MVLGLSKGTVIFMTVDNLKRIHTRVSIHRQAIVHIAEVPGCDTFVSSCVDFNLALWNFKDGYLNVMQYT